MRVPGLQVRAGKRGKVYKFKLHLYRDGVYQRTVYETIGRVEDLSYAQAVTKAEALANMVRGGIDPSKNIPPPTAYTVRMLAEHYVCDLGDRGKGQRFRRDVMHRFEKYLGGWLDRPFTSITRQECRDMHAKITRLHGPRVANQTLTNFGTAWNIAIKTMDGDIPSNPVAAVRKHPELAKDYGAFSFSKFKADVAAASEMRRLCWQFGILSGLRPGNLKSIRREWLHADRLVIPRDQMKIRNPARGSFVLPLSKQMRAVVKKALRVGGPDSKWLWPANSKSGHIEQLHPYGHVLRHVHRSVCTSVGVQPEVASLLHDHAIEGIADIYVQRGIVSFDTLLQAQEVVSATIINSLNGLHLPEKN